MKYRCLIISLPYPFHFFRLKPKFFSFKYSIYLIYSKKALLEKWGYSIYDADFLKSEIEKQAQLAIQCGEYELDVLDGYGQRIDTVIHLKRKDTGEDVTFVAGWMVYPDGEIVLVTPYGDDK